MKKLFGKMILSALIFLMAAGSFQCACADRRVRCVVGRNIQWNELTAYQSVRYDSEGIYVFGEDERFEIDQTYDLKGMIQEEVFAKAGKGVQYTATYTYDENGRLLLKKMVLPDGTLLAEEACTYNDQGLKSRYETRMSDGSVLYADEYFYDDSGRITRQDTYNEEGRMSAYDLHMTDENGILRSVDVYNVDEAGKEEMYGSWICDYDDAGRLVSRVWNPVDPESNSTLFSYYYTYDADGRLTAYERVAFKVDESLVYTYDAEGYLISGRSLVTGIEFQLVYEDLKLKDSVAEAAERWTRELYPDILQPN